MTDSVDPVAIDFETYYDAEYSLKKMSAVRYVHDPRFECQLVALQGRGIDYVGSVQGAPWTRLIGVPLLAHNMSFDGQVIQRLMKDGAIPDLKTPSYHDSADVGSYFQYCRSLELMAPAVLGVEVSKKIRDQMKGRRLASLSPEEFEAFRRYGASDAKYSLGIWKKLAPAWPAIESWMSSRNIQRGLDGIRVDIPRLDRGIELFEDCHVQLLRQLPWVPAAPPLSPKALHEYGRKVGIPTPASLAADNDVAIAWEEKYGAEHAWVRAVRNFRRVNTFLSKLKALRDAVVDGRFRFTLKYFGAVHTGRFSGGGGFNLQNLPRKPAVICKNCWTILLEDVDADGVITLSDDVTPVTKPCANCGSTDREALDLRGLFLPNEGEVFVPVDFAQIEARFLIWQVNDLRSLELLKPNPVTGKRMSVYEAHAAATMGWIPRPEPLSEVNKSLYGLAKARVLSLGYGLGQPAKFIKQAKLMARITLSKEEAESTISAYRAANPLIVQRWRDHDNWLRASARHNDPAHELVLASGRVVRYFKPTLGEGLTKDGKPTQKVTAFVTQGGGNARHPYGALLTENETQANSRDAMVEGQYAVHQQGIECAFDVHDEVVPSIPEDRAEEALATLKEFMPAASKTWAKGCPIEVTGGIVRRYCKL